MRTQFIGTLLILLLAGCAFPAKMFAQAQKTRIAIIGLDHDHVWELLRYIANEPEADLVAIADGHANLVEKAKSLVPSTVKFYSDYVAMLDQAKPEAVFVTTENDKHLQILRACAKRHIHYSTEKPMATNAADALEMRQVAEAANIKLMVNYWNAWTASTHELVRRVKSGGVGPIRRIVVQYGHQGPKEIGVSKEFAEWLYDPSKNGGGAIMDFGCYGAEMVLLLKGRPMRVYATTRKLKTDQHNSVDDDATIVLDYPDGTVLIEPSWDWPYNMDRTYVFGSNGELLSTRTDLFMRSSNPQAEAGPLDGETITLGSVPHELSNPIAYLMDRVRNNKPVEDPLSAQLNVQVMEILDAARESARTGKAQELR
jgi:predicted dehydrogenase